MISFEGMKAEESKSGKYESLPAGPYVATIKNVMIDGEKPDQSLVLRMDIIEGEYAGYFTKRYKHDQEAGGQYAVRYKGDFRLRIPNPDNPRALYPESDKRRFNDAIWRIEKSNDGFHWAGDEKTLIGKTVGLSMQEDTYNGATFTRIARLEVAQDVRAGIVKPMAPRKRQEPAAPVPDPLGFNPVDVEVPFF